MWDPIAWFWDRNIYKSRRSVFHYPLVFFDRLSTHRHISGRNNIPIYVFAFCFFSVYNVSHSISKYGLVPTKLLKYLPMENGGQVLFPITYMLGLFIKEIPKTKWNSFDQRSFFPHTDRFKLRVAVVEGNLNLVKTILDRGKVAVDIEVLDKTGTAALGLAAMLGRTQVLEYLRDRGANLDYQDENGNTALMLAVMYQQDRAMQLLIESGAQLDLKDKYGYTVLDKAANRGYSQVETYLRAQSQRPQSIHVNPVTPTLEQFAYLRKPSAPSLVQKYDPGSLFIGQEYPYYKETQGLLVCMFGNYTNLDITDHLHFWTSPNPKDDKASTDQEFFAFGRIMQEASDAQDALNKAKKAAEAAAKN